MIRITRKTYRLWAGRRRHAIRRGPQRLYCIWFFIKGQCNSHRALVKCAPALMCAQVLECSWDELWNKVQQAQDLDHIIAAHDVFLDTIISRCLLDSNSRVTHAHTHTHTHTHTVIIFLAKWDFYAHFLELFSRMSVQSLLNQLRAIFDQIIEFQSAQDSLYRSALEELSLRLQYEEKKRQRDEEVGTEWPADELLIHLSKLVRGGWDMGAYMLPNSLFVATAVLLADSCASELWKMDFFACGTPSAQILGAINGYWIMSDEWMLWHTASEESSMLILSSAQQENKRKRIIV